MENLCVWIISCFVWFDDLKFWTGFVGEVFSETIWFVFSRRAFVGFILSCMSQLGDDLVCLLFGMVSYGVGVSIFGKP